MFSKNLVILAGNISSDPEKRQTPNGNNVANFSIATNKYNPQTKKTSPQFHKIVAWRGKADYVVNYLKKGSLVYIEGELTTRTYDDQNGNKRYVTEIVANDVQGISAGQQPQMPEVSMNQPTASQNQLNQPSEQQDMGLGGSDPSDDLPF